jgi:hypothetical protein
MALKLTFYFQFFLKKDLCEFRRSPSKIQIFFSTSNCCKSKGKWSWVYGSVAEQVLSMHKVLGSNTSSKTIKEREAKTSSD